MSYNRRPMQTPESDRPTLHKTPVTGAGSVSGPGLPEPSLPQEDLSSDPLLSRFPRDERGRPLLGRIPIVRRIGKGGMGSVYYGIHPRLKIEVAVKILPYHLVEEDPRLVERFAAEARMAALIGNDHVVRVLDVDQDQGTHFLVMEFVPGESAGALLKRRVAEGKGGVAEEEAVEIVLAATRGLAAAHARGIIHRDIKPDNILIPGGDVRRAKLADLGLARPDAGGQSLGTQANVAMGTPGFMAPEQVEDARAAGPAADLFSIGATLHALLAGRSPFQGSSLAATLRRTTDADPDSLPESVRPALRSLVARCLAKRPEARPADAAALISALEALRPTSGVATGPTLLAIPQSVVPTPAPAPQGVGPLVLIGVLFVVVLGVVFALARIPGDDPVPTPTPSATPAPTADPSADADRVRRFRRILETADELAIAAEAKGSTDAWRPVLFALSKAESLASAKAEREEVAALLATARQRMAWAEARQAEERGDLEGAIALAKRAVESGPASPELVKYHNDLVARWNEVEVHRKEEFLRLSSEAKAAGDPNEALRLWSEALDVATSAKDQAECRREIGVLTRQLWAEKGTETEPEELLASAQELRSRGDLDAALDKVSKAIARRPAWAEALHWRSLIRKEKGDLDGALVDAGRAIELEPGNALYLEARAWVRLALTDFPGCEEDCTRTLAISNSATTLYLRGLARRYRGDYAGSLADLTAAVDQSARKAFFLAQRATTHWEFGRYEEAEADFARAVADDPDEMTTYNDWGWYYVRRGRLDDAIKKAEEGLARDPESANTYNVRGYARMLKGDLRGSLEDYDKMARLSPREVASYSTRGYVKARLGDFEAAAADFARGREVSDYRRGGFWIEYWTAAAKALETRARPAGERAAGFAKALELLEAAMRSPHVDGDCMCHATQKEHLREDADFLELRDDPRFKALVAVR